MPENKEALSAFLEALTCPPSIYSWHYDADGALLDTNSPETLLNAVFEHSGCLAYMQEYRAGHREPLVLSAELGMIWCAAFTENDTYVIGPNFNMEVSTAQIEKTLKRHDLSYSERQNVKKVLQSVPVFTTSAFFQFGIMLHFYVTGEKLSTGSLQFQQQPSSESTKKVVTSGDRMRVFQLEQALLQHVRNGEINYRSSMERAMQYSNGMRINTEDPIENAKLSAHGFIRLCTHAAIEGGLTPEIAYSLGDGYSQKLLACKTFAECRMLNHTMYEDFITRVHQLTLNANYSKVTQNCIDYIMMHVEDELSLGILADYCGYAESHLSRRFKQETGENIRDYIRYVRIERAKLLLTSTDESISQIAARLHYCSSTSFSDNFRRIVGKLPAEYRRER